MYTDLKIDTAVIYYIKNLFSSYSFVTILDEFPDSDLIIPTIAIESSDLETEKYEMGNRKRKRRHYYYINIFAQNKSQRDEFGYYIVKHLEEDSIPVYDYDQGFPPTVIPSIGYLTVEDLKMSVIKVFPELSTKLYYRAVVEFSADYSELGG